MMKNKSMHGKSMPPGTNKTHTGSPVGNRSHKGMRKIGASIETGKRSEKSYRQAKSKRP